MKGKKSYINLLVVFLMLFATGSCLTLVAKDGEGLVEDSVVEDIDTTGIKGNINFTEINSNERAAEKQFIYSSQASGSQTMNLYNPETLATHSYITCIGYLMEYLGVNAKDSNYYDVRFQGGIYAIHSSDVARFIPLSSIKSFPYYENKDGYVVHRVEGNPLQTESWYLTTTLGKVPSWMVSGKKYYSFSGIYFVDSPEKLGNYTQQVNAVNGESPYYDYYLYQPMRTKTSYSAQELNDAFNTLVGGEQTKMTATGSNFINAQNKYGVNALMMLSMGIHESNYGKSNFAVDRNNLFGVGAYDSDPGQAAYFSSIPDGINEQGNYLSWVYADADYQSGANYYGANLGNKSSGMNVKYASDPFWGEKIANYYARIDRMLGEKDYQKYGLAIVKQGATIFWDSSGANVAHNYKNSTSLLTYMYPVVTYNDATLTEIALEPSYNAQGVVGSRYPAGGEYNWYKGYVNSNNLIRINESSGNGSNMIVDGNMTYYLNKDSTIKYAEEKSSSGLIVKRIIYQNGTVYGKHLKKERYIFKIKTGTNNEIEYMDEYNTSNQWIRQYRYFSGITVDNYVRNYRYIFKIKTGTNGEIEYMDEYNTSNQWIRQYRYFSGVTVNNYVRNYRYIFKIKTGTNGEIEYMDEYNTNNQWIRQYRYFTGITVDNYVRNYRYIFKIKAGTNGEIEYMDEYNTSNQWIRQYRYFTGITVDNYVRNYRYVFKIKTGTNGEIEYMDEYSTSNQWIRRYYYHPNIVVDNYVRNYKYVFKIKAGTNGEIEYMDEYDVNNQKIQRKEYPDGTIVGNH